jgi:PKD repeat protein
MFSNLKQGTHPYLLVLFAFLIFTGITSCENETKESFTVDFSYEYVDDNSVKFVNLSQGEYYSLDWDFGNGRTISTTDKNKTYTIYYPEAGDYQVTLTVLNFTGVKKLAAKTVSIAQTDVVVSFTAIIDDLNPNNVNLENTSEGEYDSFKWFYNFKTVENEMNSVAYFPLAGKYDIELQLYKGSDTLSQIQSVTIINDDPNFSGLIWSEEFDYSGMPNKSKWNMEIGGGGWGNQELQYYTNRESNASVSNGTLKITARKENFEGNQYTSARITTQNKFDFKYGRIEARIKLPYGKGIWPAFWMLGKNFNSVGWPACGEIDIMELFGGPDSDNIIRSTLHWENNGERAEYGEDYKLPSGIFADDFHIFSLEWDDKQVVSYVDGIQYYSIDITPAELSEFRKNFFIILNVAVGGNRPGSPDSSTQFPQTMEIDYVRVYR